MNLLGRIIRETDLAVLVALTPGPGVIGHEVWIPKSVIDNDVEVDEDEEVDVEIADWWARKEGFS